MFGLNVVAIDNIVDDITVANDILQRVNGDIWVEAFREIKHQKETKRFDAGIRNARANATQAATPPLALMPPPDEGTAEARCAPFHILHTCIMESTVYGERVCVMSYE